MPKLIEPILSTSLENSVQLENSDPPSEINISLESDVSTDPKNITCIFCDKKTKKHRFKRFLLFHFIKKDFLSKIDQENANYAELVDKIVNYSDSKTYCHITCQLKLILYTASYKKTTKSCWQKTDLH